MNSTVKTLAVVSLTLLSADALAYLDAGTGSMILQVVLGGVAGLVVAGKLYWHRIQAFFGIKRDLPPELDEPESKVASDDGDSGKTPH